MNDTQLLERLGKAYASVRAPAPSAELAACIARGGEGEADDEGRPGAVVVPLVVRRPRTRLRYMVAAAVTALAVFSGLAVAGALPDPVQRQVSSFASHFGLDLPTPGGADDVPRTSGRTGTTNQAPAIAPVTGQSTTEPVVPPAAQTPASPTTPATTIAGALTRTLGEVGAIGGSATTTIPSTGGTPLTEPEVTLPPPTAPQATLPQATLPPPTLPSTTLPPPTLPPVTVPQLPPLPLPGL